MTCCATCKFFNANGKPFELYDGHSDEVYDTGHRRCLRILHGNGDGGAGFSTVIAAEPAIVTDGSGYAASLRVLPTFSCGLYEEREQSKAYLAGVADGLKWDLKEWSLKEVEGALEWFDWSSATIKAVGRKACCEKWGVPVQMDDPIEWAAKWDVAVEAYNAGVAKGVGAPQGERTGNPPTYKSSARGVTT